MSEQEAKARRERLAQWREEGVEPFPARTGPYRPVAELRERHGAKEVEALEAEAPEEAVAGRILGARSFGKLLFLRLFEGGSEIQLSVRKPAVDAETFRRAKALDVGDLVRAEGPVWRTKKGELTLDVRAFDLLAKSLRPLPEKWHGLQDVEARFRQRYLDLLANPRAREIAVLRSRVVSSIRRYLDARGYLEVETPVLQPLYGGAAARPFTTYHNALGQRLYLRISDELYLKRLVVGGLDRVYEIGRDFRNEGISRKHNPEFSMLECYRAYADYRDMMALAEELLPHVAREVLGTTRIEYQGRAVELAGPWRRVSMRDALREATGVDILAAEDVEGLRARVREAGLEPGEATTWAGLVDDLFGEHVEPNLVQPTFVIDHPLELSPLAKRSEADPRLVERFELVVAGFELVNAFSELNDPDEQRRRFEGQGQAAAAGDEEAHPMDEDFLRALEHGMPPTGGLGLGVDRLAMLLADAPNLREVILFPHLRPESR